MKLRMNHLKRQIHLPFSANGISMIYCASEHFFFLKQIVARIIYHCPVPSSLQCKKLQCLPSEMLFIGMNNWGWGHRCNLNSVTEGRPEMQELDIHLFPHHKAISLTSLSFKHWQLRPTTATCNLCMRFSKLACITKDISEISAS